jgi:hypothetical protein
VEEIDVFARRHFSFCAADVFFLSIGSHQEKNEGGVLHSRGEWKMVFAEISFAANTVESARLRRFYPDHEVVFDYKFDSTGRLTGLLGSVDVWGQWLGEADLYPEADGTVGKVHVKYYRASSRDTIARPEDAEEYTAELSSVPIYRTPESLPCGGSLQEAEKMNATQE